MKKLLLIYLFLYPSICDSQLVSFISINDSVYALDPTTGITKPISKFCNTSTKHDLSDSVRYLTKYRHDTSRNNIYTVLAGKQASGNYLTANPNIGTATGTSLAVTGAITSSGGGLGYTSGNGGTVTQLTSKSTGVTLNKLTGDITLNGAALAAATIVSFTITNSTVAATDAIIVQHQATGTFGAYTINGRTANGSAVISVRNNTAGSLSEAIVIKFTIIKSVTN